MATGHCAFENLECLNGLRRGCSLVACHGFAVDFERATTLGDASFLQFSH